MNKRNLVVTLLVACMLVGTVAFAETGSFRVGAGFVGLVDSEDSDAKALGYELAGKVWFSQLPQLTVSGSYTNLGLKNGDVKVSTLSDIAVVGEYRIYNETNYGFAVNAGWLNKGVTLEVPADAERKAENYLTVGGKGNYVLMDGLQAIAGVSYAFNNLFKEEAAPTLAIISAKVGAEYDVVQAPGLKLGAYFLYNQKSAKVEGLDAVKNTAYGFNVGASYAVNF